MITLETQITGYAIGKALADDPEELAYAFEALGDRLNSDKLKEFSECCCEFSQHTQNKIKNALQTVLDCLNNEED